MSDRSDPIASERPPSLHFDEDEFVVTLDDEIDLPPPLVSKELQRNAAGVIEPTLEDFGRDPGLKDRAPRNMGDKGLGVTNAEKEAHEPGVEEIQLRCL
ncbi:unannotated protein [freshwater metagenome]|uniref:Unannotated protein n=1 Tax=freshwater metagenome TaxID=449393 RepID=A0A6J7P2S6_9ZZZZ